MTETLLSDVVAAQRTMMGARARLLRLGRGWTQEQLATAARVTTNTIRGFERGTKQTQPALITQIAQALDTTCEALQQQGDVGVPRDPLLKELNREDLEIAHEYHHATTAMRQRVRRVLQDRTTDSTRDDAAAERWQQMTPEQRDLALRWMKMFVEHGQAAAAATTTAAPTTPAVESKKRRRRSGTA